MTSPLSVLFAGLLVLAPASSAPPSGLKEPGAVVTPAVSGKVLRGFIVRCEQQGGVTVITVNKQDAISIGCARASWDAVEVPD